MSDSDIDEKVFDLWGFSLALLFGQMRGDIADDMIRLTVAGIEGERSVCGTVFGEDDYRIVRIDDYHVETVPAGHILVLHNQDRPGVIGFIGQVLGEAGINIAMMNLSRRKIQDRAMSLINVDSRIPDGVLNKLRDNEFILSAVQVEI
jgi:D-3-phosphoglycerate dehydrogenase